MIWASESFASVMSLPQKRHFGAGAVDGMVKVVAFRLLGRASG